MIYNPKKYISRAKASFKNMRGITILEIIVSTGLFSVVMVVALTSLLSIIDANKKSRSLQVAINNLNFAIDGMAREIRFGSSYHCEDGSITNPTTALNCASGGDHFAFEGTAGDDLDSSDQIIYRLSNGRIERSEDSGSNYTVVTGSDVTVDNLTFFVTGAESNDTDSIQGDVRIVMDATANLEGSKTETKFSLQTAISERSIPFTIVVGGNDSSFVECPFDEDDGIVVDFSDVRLAQTLTIADLNGWFKMAGAQQLDTVVPPGTYDIKLAAYDDHSACPGNPAPDVECHDNVPSGTFIGERLRIQLLSYGRNVFTTNPTDDIPPEENVSYKTVNTGVTLTDTITHINPIPGESPGAATSTYSITWLCAAFENTSGVGDPIDIDEI